MRKYKLRELLTIKNGCDYRHLSTGSVPVYGSGGFMCFVNQAMSNKPSILLPRKGTLNNIMFIDKPFWTVDTMYWSEIKEDIVEPYYLYNYLKVLKFDGIRTGSTLPSMTSSAYYDIPVILPDYNKQTRVANILKLLNNKIELNNKINQELEQMAKILYDYWFVQFDFPDEKGRPYKSANGKMVYNEVLKREIPEGWEVKSLYDYLSLIKDGTHNPPKRIIDNGIALLTGTMFDKIFLNYNEATYISFDDYTKIHKTYKPEINDIVITKIGTIGKINILTPSDIPLAVHCNSAILRTKDSSNTLFLLFLLKSQEFQKHLRKKMSKTIQEYINLEQLSNVDVIFPPRKIQNSYSSLVAPIYEKLKIIQKENKTLIQTRDFLLPLLMNGQVSVQC